MHFEAVWAGLPLLLSGALKTILYAVAGYAAGLALAMLLIVGRLAYGKAVSRPTAVFVEIVRNTPFLVQAFFLYFGLARLGFSMSPVTAAIIIVTFNSLAYTVEILRSGLMGVPRGMIEAGESMSFSAIQMFRYVIARPMLRATLPALSGQFIIIMLNTSLLSAIAIPELTYEASNLASSSFRPFEVYVAIAVIYFTISAAFAGVFALLTRAVTGDWAKVDLARRGIL